MVFYIKQIVWKHAKHEPENFKLLDARHNIVKSLILSDCDHLIKFILFGDEETGETDVNKNVCKEKEKEGKGKKEKVKGQRKFETRHIPRNILWLEEEFIKNDDLDFDVIEDKLDNEKIKLKNNMELAIYRCKGN